VKSAFLSRECAVWAKAKLIYGKFLFGRHSVWINPKRTLETSMTMHAPVLDGSQGALLAGYLENLSMLERMHRLLLDVIKDEFERVAILEINSVQALLLFNIGENEVTAGELKSRGFYQGSNVSYNLKKLVELGYMHHQRSEIDRRSVRVRLTEKGRRTRQLILDLLTKHAETFSKRGTIDNQAMETIGSTLKRLERFWTEQIRYIY